MPLTVDERLEVPADKRRRGGDEPQPLADLLVREQLRTDAEGRATFRDVPPVELYASQPLQLAAGTVMRTTCRWENRTGEAAYFPQEMCTGFGVLAGTKELYDCRTGF